MKLILASASSRRSEILNRIGIVHEVLIPTVCETPKKDESIIEFVVRLSKEKAISVTSLLNEPKIVLGADTMVVLEEKWLGKPQSEEDAYQMLLSLSGRSHFVYTGFTLLRTIDNYIISDYEITKVFFKPLQIDEIRDYIITGEPLDKAGAYGLQGYGARYIHRIEGCFYNVMGLPASKVYESLKKIGFR